MVAIWCKVFVKVCHTTEKNRIIFKFTRSPITAMTTNPPSHRITAMYMVNVPSQCFIFRGVMAGRIGTVAVLISKQARPFICHANCIAIDPFKMSLLF